MGEPVNAFSIGFHEERYDELHYARVAARHFGAAHHSKIITPEEALELLPRLVEIYDEPFGNNSAIGAFFCAQLARESGVNLLLAGDGGDEIFGGNERYRTDRIFGRYHRIPGIIRRGLIEPILLGMPDRDGEGILGGPSDISDGRTCPTRAASIPTNSSSPTRRPTSSPPSFGDN